MQKGRKYSGVLFNRPCFLSIAFYVGSNLQESRGYNLWKVILHQPGHLVCKPELRYHSEAETGDPFGHFFPEALVSEQEGVRKHFFPPGRQPPLNSRYAMFPLPLLETGVDLHLTSCSITNAIVPCAKMHMQGVRSAFLDGGRGGGGGGGGRRTCKLGGGAKTCYAEEILNLSPFEAGKILYKFGKCYVVTKVLFGVGTFVKKISQSLTRVPGAAYLL